MNQMAYDLPYIISPHLLVVNDEKPAADVKHECGHPWQKRFCDKQRGIT